jgi:hypothetical protein
MCCYSATGIICYHGNILTEENFFKQKPTWQGLITTFMDAVLKVNA